MKTKLLNTLCFIDNIYLNKYIKLCENGSNKKTIKYSELHHIIPFSYFSKKLQLSTKKEKAILRRNCIKVGTPEYDLITKNNSVFLSYCDHCLAHYYLYKCTIGQLKIDNEIAFNKMTDRNLVLRDCKDADIKLILKYIKDIRNDPESQSYKSSLIDKVITDNYNHGGYKLCLKILQDTYNIISSKEIIKGRAQKLSIVSANFTEAWTEEEINILKNIYPQEGYIGCQKYLPNRTKFAIQARAKYLNILAPGASKVNSAWTEYELAILQSLYPTGGWKAVHEKLSNRSEKSIKHQANKRKIYVIKNRGITNDNR